MAAILIDDELHFDVAWDFVYLADALGAFLLGLFHCLYDVLYSKSYYSVIKRLGALQGI